METRQIDIQTADGLCDAYISYRPGIKSLPGVLFYMDGFGLRPRLYEIAEKIASLGYYVLLPNLFYRKQKAPTVTEDLKKPEGLQEAIKKIMPLIGSLRPEMSMRDAAAYIDFMEEQKNVWPGNIAITGYCMGGSLAIRTAAHFPDKIACAASFHAGRLATDAEDSPHLLANKITAELYLAHADNDQSMDVEQMKRLNRALDEAKVQYVAETYTGAAHGFTMEDLPAHNQEAEDRHWRSLFELFGKYF